MIDRLSAARREVAVSHLAGVLAGAGATMLGPLLPVLSRNWSLNDAQGGTLLAAEFLGGFCGAIASGWLGARQSLLNLLTAGLLLMALGFGGSALMEQAWMPVCLFVCGLGLGFINPMANLIVSRASQPAPAAALNLFGFSWAAGALATPAAIAVLLRSQTPASVFSELAVFAAAVSALAVFVTVGTGDRARAQTATGKSSPATVRSGAFIGITGALLFLYVGIETSVSVWLPTCASRWAGLTLSQAAAMQSAFWMALLLGRLLAPVWLRRLSPGALVFAGLLTGAAGIALLLAPGGGGIMLAGAILAGLGLAPVNPTIVAAFTMRLGRDAARWTGPVFAASGLGGAAIPWLVGAVSSAMTLRVGLAAPLIGVGAMAVLQAVAQNSETQP